MSSKFPRTFSAQQLNLLAVEDLFFNKLKNMGRSHNTLKNYKTDLECFHIFLLQNQKSLDISKFHLPQIEAYGQFLDKKYTSDNSRRRRVQTLRIFFDFLVEKRFFESNPVRKLKTSPKFLDVPRPTPFVDVKTLWTYLLEEVQTDQKIAQLLAKRNQITLLLIFGAGLKVSDLSALEIDQILLPKQKPDNVRVLINHTKRDPYSVSLPSVFQPIFDDYMKNLKQMKKESNIEFNKVLFNANPYKILSGGLSSRGLEMIFEDFRKKLMIDLTPKSLRQACVFKWLHQKRPENLIKEWLGVAPSYSLKPYKDSLSQYCYSDDFLEEMHKHYRKKTYSQV